MQHLKTLPLALMVLALLLAGCELNSAPPRLAPSGTLRWSLEGVSEIGRLDPARLGGYQESIPVYLIFGGLVRINDKLEVVGDGAERWTVSDDGTVYTFYLRPNLSYGDGSPAKAQDFADALARAIAPNTGTDFALAFLENVLGARAVSRGEATTLAGARAIDERTLEITLDSPRGYFLSQLTYALTYLVPPNTIEAAGDAWVGRAFGTGPFRVKRYVAGERLVLEGNPHYWAGPPGVAEVEFLLFADTDSAFSAYQAGQVEIMGSIQGGVPAARLAEVRSLPEARTLSTPAVRYIGFNNALPPFNNTFVRQAFAQAVDKDALARQVLGGTAVAAERILPKGFPGAESSVDTLGFDPVGARAALTFAGYTQETLPPVTLTFERGDADTANAATALQRNWRETLGVNVKLEAVERQLLIDRLDATRSNPSDSAQALQMYISIWGADYPDPQNFLSLQLRSESPYNNGHWSNARFDDLTAQADTISEVARRAERLELYAQAEELAVREVGWLPLYSPQATMLIRPTVRGLVPTSTPQGIIAPDWTQVAVATQ